LNPLEQCVAPSIQVTPELTTLPSQSNYAQTRWLAKTLPEAGSAKTLISFIQRTESATQNSASSSSLLAIGRASDIDHTSGLRDVQIVAMAHGQAGNILRLIKPRVEALGWDGRHGTKLRSLNPASSEECFWAEDGGSIQHITFAADGDGQTSWLAVLKAEFTTILRPIYRRVQAPSPLIAHSSIRYPASRLSANPILTLKNEKTGARPHVDVSFNPWYIRQFAIFDQQGYWTVWDIEGQKRRRATFEAKPGKSGHIHDDLISDQSFKIYGSADGWGRIMWAGSVSTLVVCDRRSLAVFDLKSAPKRLYSPELVHPNSTDWILDVKRNPNNLHQIFVLTSNQVFWLQINAAGEDRDGLYGYVGARILLSCRHFRNGEDDTAKFELFGEKDGMTNFRHICVCANYPQIVLPSFIRLEVLLSTPIDLA
jgi:RNA polymerase I-specific transcription initiation factor RRN6